MKTDLVKIVERVWEEEDLHSGTYKIAALTCLHRLEEIANQRVIEELERAKTTKSWFYVNDRIQQLKQDR